MYEKNSGRDIKDQKHAPLMLVLMWAAKLWSSIRGVEPTDKPTVLLGDNKDSGWTFDPHALVAFQDNCFDCGIHVRMSEIEVLYASNTPSKATLIVPEGERSRQGQVSKDNPNIPINWTCLVGSYICCRIAFRWAIIWMGGVGAEAALVESEGQPAISATR
ncbi:hypothetical protein BT96DRAFT_941747 [Gymnopus androsaceus JB14]|uniref:Uncharacterized protein n=1 Tax=Gymnopus androsaceus JB14 TaxID=1447944 RepID=A0A6A4HEP3_9AGAR|nr:hypothetical protein BT96DRAFT_941747 [Gymnopus androsaceus JB14]